MKWLFLMVCIAPFHLSAEEPPPPEYPYPGNSGKNKREIPGIEKPVKKDILGTYYYSKKRKKKKPKVPETGEKPYKVGRDGTYYYSTKKNKKKKPPLHGIEKPKSINSQGEYIYNDKNTFKFNGVLSVLGGSYKPPKAIFTLENGYTGTYSKEWPFLFRLDYEQRLVDSLFLKIGSGVTVLKGQFSNEEKAKKNSRSSLFPTTLSLSYKLSVWDTQYLTPYADAGTGYFIESRKEESDGDKKPRYHQVYSFGFGILVSLSKLDRTSTLNEYGITQSWLDFQYRKIISTNSSENFTSDMITGGFAFGFGEKKKPIKINGENPGQKNKDGSHVYNHKTLPGVNRVFSLLGGVYGPPDIQSTRTGGQNYQEMYSDKMQLVLQFEYDWKLFNSVFLKLGSGVTQAEGKGQFLNANHGLEPRETFQFYIFPTTLSLSYKLSVWDTQYLTPHADAGMGYFGFVEHRSDGNQTHYGGAFVSSLGLGILISLSNSKNGTSTFNEYGIIQSWLNLQYRRIIGLDDRKDFSSDMITGGVAFGF